MQVNKNNTHRDVNNSVQEDDTVPNFFYYLLEITTKDLKGEWGGSKFLNKMKELFLWKTFHIAVLQ